MLGIDNVNRRLKNLFILFAGLRDGPAGIKIED